MGCHYLKETGTLSSHSLIHNYHFSQVALIFKNLMWSTCNLCPLPLFLETEQLLKATRNQRAELKLSLITQLSQKIMARQRKSLSPSLYCDVEEVEGNAREASMWRLTLRLWSQRLLSPVVHRCPTHTPLRDYCTAATSTLFLRLHYCESPYY